MMRSTTYKTHINESLWWLLNNENTFNKNNKNLTRVNLYMDLRFVNFSKKNSKAPKLKFTCAIRNTIYNV